MEQHNHINYIELPSPDFAKTATFYSRVFNWKFESYGDDYMAFFNAGLEGGFFLSDKQSSTESGAALVVIYASDLELCQQRVEQAGGKTVQAIFSFPGGRRFHFADPTGNELAVWSDDKQSLRR